MAHFVIVREERYRRVVRPEEQYKYHMVPTPQEDPVKILLEHFGKRAEQKTFADHQKQSYSKGPYIVQQEPPMTHKVHNYTIPHQGPNYAQIFDHQEHMVNQAPSLKSHRGVMNSKDAAKIYGGVEFTKYS